MEIGCFIDYDNLEESTKSKGLKWIVTHIIFSIEDISLDQLNRLVVRIYGGWSDTESKLTRNAISLQQDIEKEFPCILSLKENENSAPKISCNVELAFSLLEIPGDIFNSTYRTKALSNHVRCHGSNSIGCINSDCIADVIKLTVNKRKCPNPPCSRPIEEFMFRNEQKMVDTHLTCDLIFSASFLSTIILVSSDDDFIPLIKTITGRRLNIILFETKNRNHSNLNFLKNGIKTYRI